MSKYTNKAIALTLWLYKILYAAGRAFDPNRSVMKSNPINCSRCFIEQEKNTLIVLYWLVVPGTDSTAISPWN